MENCIHCILIIFIPTPPLTFLRAGPISLSPASCPPLEFILCYAYTLRGEVIHWIIFIQAGSTPWKKNGFTLFQRLMVKSSPVRYRGWWIPSYFRIDCLDLITGPVLAATSMFQRKNSSLPSPSCFWMTWSEFESSVPNLKSMVTRPHSQPCHVHTMVTRLHDINGLRHYYWVNCESNSPVCQVRTVSSDLIIDASSLTFKVVFNILLDYLYTDFQNKVQVSI